MTGFGSIVAKSRFVARAVHARHSRQRKSARVANFSAKAHARATARAMKRQRRQLPCAPSRSREGGRKFCDAGVDCA